MPSRLPFADLALARRLERAEGTSCARSVEARARVFPERGASWTEIAGAYAMFDGPESPMTQTFGLGLFEVPASDALAAIERFYEERGAPAFHEVSPLADMQTFALLNARGYQPFEFTSVMFRGLEARDGQEGDDGDGRITIRRAGPDDAEVYARTAAEGWREFGFAEFVHDMARVYATTEGVDIFLAELDGRAIATGVLSIHAGVAHLAGASTIPAGRRRGAQNALLDHRLRFAAERGCDIALMGALPGSGSQRNAERNGFRIAYTRVKFRRR
ncbi:MAG: GNAT family N-acetyltransferase [Acidobacteria bacterium]|nr:GNAT family N-acetyltransferase [Acidobacteriota bacterium]